MNIAVLPSLRRACAGLLLLVLPGCAPPLLSVDDTIAQEGKPALLAAYVGREHWLGLRTGIECIPVSFYVNGRNVGQNTADRQGRAVVTAVLPADNPSAFTVQVTIGGRQLTTTGRIFYWRQGRIIVAVDVDHTISQTDYDNLLTTNLPQTSPPVPDARDTLAVIASDYDLVYLTARPRFLLEKTREWLATYEFPKGPVVTAPRLWDSLRTVKWKSRALQQLRQTWPDLLIGIGNRNTDTEAYAPNDMIPVIIYSGGQELHYADAVVLQDWEILGEFFRTNHAVLADPSKLRGVVEGRVWLLQPIIPWHKPKRDVKARTRASTMSRQWNPAMWPQEDPARQIRTPMPGLASGSRTGIVIVVKKGLLGGPICSDV